MQLTCLPRYCSSNTWMRWVNECWKLTQYTVGQILCCNTNKMKKWSVFEPKWGGNENAGVENPGVGLYRRGGKCRSRKCRSDKVWKAIRRKYSKVPDEIWLSRLSCLLVAKRNSQASRPVNVAVFSNDLTVSGCWFHFAQALVKRMVNAFWDDSRLQTLFRCFLPLSTPADRRDKAWISGREVDVGRKVAI